MARIAGATSPTVTIPFGKHAGEPVADLPIDYLKWLWKNVDLRGELRDAVEVALEGADVMVGDGEWERWGSGYRKRDR